MGGASLSCYMPAIMVRRTLKPFTVEVRKGGRQVKAAVVSWLADPTMLDDQPRVSWPELQDAPEPAGEAREPPVAPELIKGRVLPALDKPEPPAAVIEPKQRGDGLAGPSALAVGDLPGEVDQPAPVEVVPDIVEPEPAAPTAEKPDETVASVSDAKTMVDTLLLRHGRKRLLRSEFKRSEKWKARLPVAAETGQAEAQSALRRTPAA